MVAFQGIKDGEVLLSSWQRSDGFQRRFLRVCRPETKLVQLPKIDAQPDVSRTFLGHNHNGMEPVICSVWLFFHLLQDSSVGNCAVVTCPSRCRILGQFDPCWFTLHQSDSATEDFWVLCGDSVHVFISRNLSFADSFNLLSLSH